MTFLAFTQLTPRSCQKLQHKLLSFKPCDIFCHVQFFQWLRYLRLLRYMHHTKKNVAESHHKVFDHDWFCIYMLTRSPLSTRPPFPTLFFNPSCHQNDDNNMHNGIACDIWGLHHHTNSIVSCIHWGLIIQKTHCDFMPFHCPRKCGHNTINN